MKTLKITEKTHKNLMTAKFIFDCKNTSELIDKAIDDMYKYHNILVAELKENGK